MRLLTPVSLTLTPATSHQCYITPLHGMATLRKHYRHWCEFSLAPWRITFLHIYLHKECRIWSTGSPDLLQHPYIHPYIWSVEYDPQAAWTCCRWSWRTHPLPAALAMDYLHTWCPYSENFKSEILQNFNVFECGHDVTSGKFLWHQNQMQVWQTFCIKSPSWIVGRPCMKHE